MDWDEVVLTSLSLNSHNNHTFVYIFPLFRLSSVYFILFYSAMISSDLWVFYASTTVHCTWNKTSMKTHLVWTLISVNYWLVSNGLTRRQYIIKFKAISYKFEIWNTCRRISFPLLWHILPWPDKSSRPICQRFWIAHLLQ